MTLQGPSKTIVVEPLDRPCEEAERREEPQAEPEREGEPQTTPAR